MKRINQLCFESYLETGNIEKLSTSQLEAVTGLVGYDRDSLEELAQITIDVEGVRVFEKHPELFPLPFEDSLVKAQRKLVTSVNNVRFLHGGLAG